MALDNKFPSLNTNDGFNINTNEKQSTFCSWNFIRTTLTTLTKSTLSPHFKLARASELKLFICHTVMFHNIFQNVRNLDILFEPR